MKIHRSAHQHQKIMILLHSLSFTYPVSSHCFRYGFIYPSSIPRLWSVWQSRIKIGCVFYLYFFFLPSDGWCEYELKCQRTQYIYIVTEKKRNHRDAITISLSLEPTGFYMKLTIGTDSELCCWLSQECASKLMHRRM